MNQYSLLTEGSPRFSTGRAPSRKVTLVSAFSILAVSAVFLFAYHSDNLPSSATSLFRSTSPNHNPRVRSGWLDDEGSMEYDHALGWGSKWSTLWSEEKELEGRFKCDEKEIMSDGKTLCVSDTRVMRALKENSVLQAKILSNDTVVDDILTEQLAESAKGVMALRGKRILIAGDSICRNLVSDLFQLLEPAAFLLTYDIQEEEGEEQHSLAKRNYYMKFLAATALFPIAAIPEEAQSKEMITAMNFKPTSTQDAHHFRIDFVFLIGSLTNNPFIPYLPVDPIERIRLMHERVGGQAKYDFITANLGLWDLAAIQRKILTELSQDVMPGLQNEDTSAFVDQMDRLIVGLKELHPTSPIAVRLLHDLISGGFAAPAHPANMASVVQSPTFKPLRIVQMRNAQYAAAQRHSVGWHSFALRMQGQPAVFTFDGVHPNPNAHIVYLEMLFRDIIDRA